LHQSLPSVAEEHKHDPVTATTGPRNGSNRRTLCPLGMRRWLEVGLWVISTRRLPLDAAIG
jgi:hypothetical protein